MVNEIQPCTVLKVNDLSHYKIQFISPFLSKLYVQTF